jgi:hypothetical protein
MAVDSIDWGALAVSCGAQDSGDGVGRKAIVQVLGDDVLKSAVDYYVNNLPGSEVALSVLHVLRPEAAIRRCLEIYGGQDPIRVRRSAVELLRYIGGWRELGIVKQFLGDSDADIPAWGASFLEKLVFQESVGAADAEECVRMCEAHENALVRQAATRMRDFLAKQQS